MSLDGALVEEPGPTRSWPVAKRRWLEVSALTVLAGSAAIWAFLDTPHYEVTAAIEFEGAAISGAQRATEVGRVQATNEYLETQAVIMTSHVICDRALASLSGIQHGFERRSISSLVWYQPCAKLRAQRVGQSLVIEVRYEDVDAKRATLFVGAAIAAYFQRVRSLAETSILTPDDWGAELEQRDARLDQDEAALAAFSKQYSIGSVESEREIAEGVLKSQSDALTAARVKRVQAVASVTSLEQARTQSPELGSRSSDPTTRDLRDRARRLERERDLLSLESDGQHIRLEALRAELDAVLAQLRRADDALLASLRLEADAARKEEQDLQQAAERTRQDLIRLSGLEIEYARLRRAAERSSALRKHLLNALDKVDRQATVAGAAARILSPAHLVGQRSNRPLAAAIGLGWLIALVFMTRAAKIRLALR